MTIRIIETKDIPTGTNRGTTSKIPELLKTIPKGQTGVITKADKTFKIATIRSYIEKNHKKGQLKEYTLVQRTTTDTSTTPPTKTATLYITHEGKKN